MRARFGVVICSTWPEGAGLEGKSLAVWTVGFFMETALSLCATADSLFCSPTGPRSSVGLEDSSTVF